MFCLTASVIYYTPGPYGPIQHHEPRVSFTSESALRSACRNADAVLSRSGASHIVLDRDAGLAVQVAGYNASRGAFCDVLKPSELRS